MTLTNIPEISKNIPGTFEAVSRGCLCASSSYPWEFTTVSNGLGHAPLDVSSAHTASLMSSFAVRNGLIKFPSVNTDIDRYFNDFPINSMVGVVDDFSLAYPNNCFFVLEIVIAPGAEKRGRFPKVGELIYVRNATLGAHGLHRVVERTSSSEIKTTNWGGIDGEIEPAGYSITDSGSGTNGRSPWGNEIVGTILDLSYLRHAYWSLAQKKLVSIMGTALDMAVANATGSRRITALDSIALLDNPIAPNCPIHGNPNAYNV